MNDPSKQPELSNESGSNLKHDGSQIRKVVSTATPTLYAGTDPSGKVYYYHSISDPDAYLSCGCFIDEGCHIKRIRFNNYRGFDSEQSIDLPLPNGIPGSGLTIIVGENNSGKSTILEAIVRSNPKPFSKDEKAAKDVSLLEITNCADQSKSYEAKGSGWYSHFSQYPLKIKGADRDDYDIFPKSRQIAYIRSPRNWPSESAWKELLYDGDSGDAKKGLKEEFILGRFEHYGGEEFEDVMSDNFGYILRHIQKDKAEKDKLNRYVREVIPNFADWRVTKDHKKYIVKYQISGKSGHSSDLLGSGVHSLLRIFCSLVIERPIVLIDEPEYGLHPQAQKKLANSLVNISATRQVIIATHSPHFIDYKSIKAGATIVRAATSSNNLKRSTYSLGQEGRDYLSKFKEDWHKPEKFDSVAREVFFAKNIVFTEGKEDVALIQSFARKHNIEINFEFFGYGSGGASEIISYLQLAQELGLRAGAIFDSDDVGNTHYKKCCTKYGSKFLLKQISTEDIRDKGRIYGPHGKIIHKEKLGLFRDNGRIKEENIQELKSIINEFNDYFIEKTKEM